MLCVKFMVSFTFALDSFQYKIENVTVALFFQLESEADSAVHWNWFTFNVLFQVFVVGSFGSSKLEH